MTATALLTAAEVAAELGISASRVRKLAASRGVGSRVGPLLVFTAGDVDAMRERKQGRPVGWRKALKRTTRPVARPPGG